jgi:hypothetical protein
MSRIGIASLVLGVVLACSRLPLLVAPGPIGWRVTGLASVAIDGIFITAGVRALP